MGRVVPWFDNNIFLQKLVEFACRPFDEVKAAVHGNLELVHRLDEGTLMPEDFRRAICAASGTDVDHKTFYAIYNDIFSLNPPVAGAEGLVICTNTMHRLADTAAAAVSIPLIHIADATAVAIMREGLERVGLLGTRYTVEMDFYRARLEKAHGLEVLIPEEPGRTIVHDIIYRELAQGIIREESRRAYVEVIEALKRRGAEGVILGCTEIPLLINAADSPIPVFDTTALHAAAAVDFALTG